MDKGAMDLHTTMPFGKFKGQAMGVVLTDPNYCNWLLAQPWFQEEHPALRAFLYDLKPVLWDTPYDGSRLQVCAVLYTQLAEAYTLLSMAWSGLIDENISLKTAMAQAADSQPHASMETVLKELIALAHPDKWHDAHVATELTKHLTARLQICRGRAGKH